MSWEGDISDDCTHYILYHANIAKAFGNSNFEIEWTISKRYSQFDALHKKLQQRQNSIALKKFLIHKDEQFKDIPLPPLPSKTISPLSTLEEIEGRKQLLEIYLRELLINPAVTCSPVFREFIDEKD